MDELLGDVRPVGVRGVDEVDTHLGEAPQEGERRVAVGGGPQMPLPVMRMAP